jgi:drug/metabolite transporter (DMT)-like permease
MTASRPNDRFLWLVFVLLGLMWGSSYFFIKIGVEAGLPPLTLVASRLFFGFLVLITVVRLAREPLPRSARQYGHLVVMSVVNIVLPFFLITWGEQSIDSALAAILNATVPLFVIVIAPLFLPDEHVTLNRVVGLAVGFVGVLVLFVPNLGALGGTGLLGWFALLGSSISYAVGNVYAKRNVKGLRPMIPALFQVTFAMLISGALALLIEQPIGRVPVTLEALVAVVWLGIVGSGFAYLAYFRLLSDWGATRTSLVAYLLPVFGIALGTLIGEEITLNRILGTLLIIAGVALVNSSRGTRRLFGAAPEGAPPPSDRVASATPSATPRATPSAERP